MNHRNQLSVSYINYITGLYNTHYIYTIYIILKSFAQCQIFGEGVQWNSKPSWFLKFYKKRPFFPERCRDCNWANDFWPNLFTPVSLITGINTHILTLQHSKWYAPVQNESYHKKKKTPDFISRGFAVVNKSNSECSNNKKK